MIDVRQVFSQRTWPLAGDIDDCWVVSTIQAVNAVAPWLPLLAVPEFREAAGDPDDGKADGGNIAEIVEGITNAYPAIAPLVTVHRGATWSAFLATLKVKGIATVCVDSSKLPVPYGFRGMHQVCYLFAPRVGLYVLNPLAPDRSAPIRIATASARAAAEGYGAGKVYAVTMPTVAEAFTTHPLYRAPDAGTTAADLARCRAEALDYQRRIHAIRAKVAAVSDDIADD